MLFRLMSLWGIAVILTGCTQLTLDWAALEPDGDKASPPLLTALDDRALMTEVSEWEEQRATLADILQTEIYGTFPTGGQAKIIQHTIIDENAFGGIAIFEEYIIRAAPSFSDGEEAEFIMAVLTPKASTSPLPVIMMETFCPRWSAIPHPKASTPEGTEPGNPPPGVIRFVFGRYICTPPIEEIMAKGFAIAVVQPGEVVPDHGERGLEALARLSKGHEEEATRWGAIAAWGWTFSRMVDVLSDDERFDEDRLIAYGHSRYGKAALVAGAFDTRIAGVISHQSGTGGASLNRRKKGESIGSITRTYPHWFGANYATFAGEEERLTLDQHHLLALIAPRPVLLGNARRDVWSDPNGAFRAAQGASAAYELYGQPGFDQQRLDEFQPNQPLSFWLRPGTHGVVEEDWPAFLAFLTAHFGE